MKYYDLVRYNPNITKNIPINDLKEIFSLSKKWDIKVEINIGTENVNRIILNTLSQ